MNKTQEMILQAAKKVYLDVGYTKSTFQMIANESDTSRGLINYYYPKKQDILVDLLGKHLNFVHQYVSNLVEKNSLLIYMITITIFIKSMYKSERTIAFHKDVLQRKDRAKGPYTNYNNLYENIIKEYNINMSANDLLIKEIVIFGGNAELQINYINQHVFMTHNELIENIIHNTCSLLYLNNFEINNTIAKMWDEYEKIDQELFNFFEED